MNKITSRFTNLAGGCIKRDQERLWGGQHAFRVFKSNEQEKKKERKTIMTKLSKKVE